MRFASMIQKFINDQLGSYCVWAPNHQLNDIDLDPNYLLADRVSESPFHRLLHAWASANPGLPLMHIDIHGKMDRKDSYELDLGGSCLYKHWTKYNETNFINSFITTLTKGFTHLLAPLHKYKDYQALC
jgi:hypothetical protein